ncbi:MAG: Integral rane protein TerC [Myxococcaceae bacterium]|nr:Integral rane protein TerC [Myxococcaceae bacterium]
MGSAVPIGAWLALAAVVLGGLAVDLVAHRGDGAQGRRWALVWSGIWIALALAFGAWIAVQFGLPAAEDYLAAYLIEKSLSVDNLFVFLLVFGSLRIPRAEQHRVLQWGIVGAFVTRAACVAGGAALLSAWHGVVYVLGAFLVLTGLKTATDRPDERPEENGVLRFLRRHLPYTDRLHGHRFVAVEGGRRVATPLLLALLVIEITDVIFAVDSIPAVFSISREPFIVYSSNVFAILGLRALYLVLEDLLNDLKYLRYGLGAILVFAGAKMLLADHLHVPHAVSLLVVALTMAAAVVPSVIARRAERRREKGGAKNAATP